MTDDALRTAVDDELRAAADENLVVAFSYGVEHAGMPNAGRKTFGGAVAVGTGLASAFYNPVIVVDPRVTPDDIRSAVEWIRQRGLAASVQVRADLDPPLAETVREAGLEPEAERSPGMVMTPIPAEIPAPPAELDIRAVDLDRLADWRAAVQAGPNLERFNGPSLLASPNARFVVGYAGGRPVTGAVALRSPRAIGIYGVGTLEAARRRGYGGAITWAAIDAGRRAWNLDLAALQSSEMGEDVYRVMGFREVCRYVIYMPPVPAP